MALDMIIYRSIDGDIPTQRQIILFENNFPFYRSSGNNSSYPNTWFVFHGFLEQPDKDMPRGYLIKPSTHWIPIKLERKILALFDNNQELLIRFGSLPCLLISSLLGGGLWESDSGKELAAILQSRHPEFYVTWKKPQISATGTVYTREQIELINQWLLSRANLQQLSQFKQRYPRTLEDLQRLAKPATEMPMLFSQTLASPLEKAERVLPIQECKSSDVAYSRL